MQNDYTNGPLKLIPNSVKFYQLWSSESVIFYYLVLVSSPGVAERFRQNCLIRQVAISTFITQSFFTDREDLYFSCFLQKSTLMFPVTLHSLAEISQSMRHHLTGHLPLLHCLSSTQVFHIYYICAALQARTPVHGRVATSV